MLLMEDILQSLDSIAIDCSNFLLTVCCLKWGMFEHYLTFFFLPFVSAGDGKAPVAGGEEDDDEVPGQYVALNPPGILILKFCNMH